MRSAQKNIEDLRLRYWGKEKIRKVEEQEIRQERHNGTHETCLPGGIFLPKIEKPAYWKQKRLDVQAVVARLNSQTMFINITMNIWSEGMKWLGLDTATRS